MKQVQQLKCGSRPPLQPFTRHLFHLQPNTLQQSCRISSTSPRPPLPTHCHPIATAVIDQLQGECLGSAVETAYCEVHELTNACPIHRHFPNTIPPSINMFYSTVLLAAAAFTGLASAQNYTTSGPLNITASQIDPNTRASWCLAQTHSCPEICGGQAYPNSCDQVSSTHRRTRTARQSY